MKKQITKNEFYQLQGLIAVMENLRGHMDYIEQTAQDIVGDDKDDQSGHLCDILWGHRDLKEGLKLMGITVEKK